MTGKYNHRKQIIWSVCLGVIVGAGGARFYCEGGLDSLFSTSKDDFLSLPEKPHNSVESNSPMQINLEDWERRLIDKDICELQTKLYDKNIYNGKIDGIFGRLTSISISKYESLLKRSETGFPSIGVLKSLRNDVDVNERHIATPENGYVFHRESKEHKAPLTIKTSKFGAGHLVKLVDAQEQRDELVFFIKSGDSVTLEVPLGAYDLKYASGKRWISEKCLFGPGTSFSKTNKTFSFEQSNGSINGFTIELILQNNGNLRTNKIPETAW